MQNMIQSSCVGADADLSRDVPITVVGDIDGSINVICPFFTKERCLARIGFDDTKTLRDEKREVHEHSRSDRAMEYPECLFVVDHLRLV